MHRELKNKTYVHSPYQSFYIQDPKLRHIHKATVKDRVLHHAIFRILYPIFDKTFIFDSYSCRVGKGTHKAINRFREFSRKANKNNSKTCWILKCDIKKFFNSINQNILFKLIERKIQDGDLIALLKIIIGSFSISNNMGIPMGNITSQLFANIYMNEFDQFVKHKIKAKYYIRYCDDFLILSPDKDYLKNIIVNMNEFLQDKLKLLLHPNKIFIKTLAAGIDFLGWVNFFNHGVLRTTTKRRMFKKLTQDNRIEVLNSYLGLIRHGNTHKIKDKIFKLYKK